MTLYDYLTPKLDFKRKFNHRQSFLYKGRLTVQTIRKFRTGSSVRIESRIGSSIRTRIESRSFSGHYPNVPISTVISQNLKKSRGREHMLFGAVYHASARTRQYQSAVSNMKCLASPPLQRCDWAPEFKNGHVTLTTPISWVFVIRRRGLAVIKSLKIYQYLL